MVYFQEIKYKISVEEVIIFINMDSIIGPGIYWVTINIKATVIEYFHSFSIYASMEVVQLSNILVFNHIYNSTQIISRFT